MARLVRRTQGRRRRLRACHRSPCRALRSRGTRRVVTPAVNAPFGNEIAGWFDRQDWLRWRPSAESLLAERYFAASGLTLLQEAQMSVDGWDVTRQTLQQTDGLRWSEDIDPILLALIGGCDGSVPLREQVAVLAAAYDAAPETLGAAVATLVPHLVERGFIEPAGDPAGRAFAPNNANRSE